VTPAFIVIIQQHRVAAYYAYRGLINLIPPYHTQYMECSKFARSASQAVTQRHTAAPNVTVVPVVNTAQAQVGESPAFIVCREASRQDARDVAMRRCRSLSAVPSWHDKQQRDGRKYRHLSHLPIRELESGTVPVASTRLSVVLCNS